MYWLSAKLIVSVLSRTISRRSFAGHMSDSCNYC